MCTYPDKIFLHTLATLETRKHEKLPQSILKEFTVKMHSSTSCKTNKTRLLFTTAARRSRSTVFGKRDAPRPRPQRRRAPAGSARTNKWEIYSRRAVTSYLTKLGNSSASLSTDGPCCD
ncbi:hypothetical protein EVAR_12350_1 [Eumeta japonica]|uniref:Uncharacterized protein n=1 Tax=Eumeta variegata TaxID=151549 RepID=A0A4C1WZ76_EUMVA|nr:hypothetical protein EVAR_12350_1 [Eumeta japonica]